MRSRVYASDDMKELARRIQKNALLGAVRFFSREELLFVISCAKVRIARQSPTMDDLRLVVRTIIEQEQIDPLNLEMVG